MATFSILHTTVANVFSDRADIKKWSGLTEALAKGQPAIMPGKSDKTVHIIGDFGTSGEVTLEGALDPNAVDADFSALRDPQGNLIQVTGPALVAVQENVYLVRPRISAGTGVDVDVYVMSR